jgi:hypothetical protein
MGVTRREAALRSSSSTIRRSLGARAAPMFVTMMGSGVAGADTHTGFEFTIDCHDGDIRHLVSPTGAAAAAQDTSSRQVYVLAYAEFFAPDHFPAGKVVLCDLTNLTEGSFFPDLPFLVKVAP